MSQQFLQVDKVQPTMLCLDGKLVLYFSKKGNVQETSITWLLMTFFATQLRKTIWKFEPNMQAHVFNGWKLTVNTMFTQELAKQ